MLSKKGMPCPYTLDSVSSLYCLLFFGHQPVYHLANGVRIKNKKAASRAQDHLGFSYTKKTHDCERDGSGSRRCSGVSEGSCHLRQQEFPVLPVIFCTLSPLRCSYFNFTTHECSISPWSEKGLWCRAGRKRPEALFSILHIELYSPIYSNMIRETIFPHQSDRLFIEFVPFRFFVAISVTELT